MITDAELERLAELEREVSRYRPAEGSKLGLEFFNSFRNAARELIEEVRESRAVRAIFTDETRDAIFFNEQPEIKKWLERK
jgi:hypothetical protein